MTSDPQQSPRYEPETLGPNALPDWMSPDLIKATISVWEPIYGKKLTQEDAVEILRNAGLLMDVILNGHHEQKVFGAGQGFQP